MADSFGLGDGTTDLSGVGATAETSVTDARRRQPGHLEADRWPTSGTILRRIGLVVLAIVAVGLALTALNG